jgi:hypothetical protein
MLTDLLKLLDRRVAAAAADLEQALRVSCAFCVYVARGAYLRARGERLRAGRELTRFQ